MLPVEMALRGVGRLTGRPYDRFAERVDQTGRTFVVTGASAGIGPEIARGLADWGARLVLVGRDPARTASVAEQLRGHGADVSYHLADYRQLGQVETLAEELAKIPDLDGLIHNAGVWKHAREETAAGIEVTLAVNHVAPFLLTHRLLPVLRRSQTRVVVTSSRMHATVGRFPFDDPMSSGRFGGLRAYSISKLANVLFARELPRRTGLQAFAVHPGDAVTDIGREIPWIPRAMQIGRPLLMTATEAAQTVLHAATSPSLDAEETGYLAECALVPAAEAGRNDADAARLWDWTVELLERVGHGVRR